jgi:hypothetical protein
VQQVHRAPWAEFPDVILDTNGATLKAHPGYAAAKAGDAEAALQVAESLVRPDKIHLDFDVDGSRHTNGCRETQRFA